MTHQITVSNEIFIRLKNLAEPFVDQPEDVIRRLLDGSQISDGNGKPPDGRSPDSRVPRERGVRVRIDDKEIDGDSVRDLYKQVLELLVQNYRLELTAVLPFKTSGKRYLIARDPTHSTGNKFVVPVEVQGFHMEAHKDYKNAIAHLEKLCGRLGLDFKYLGE
jgi:hypothetical protein